MIMTSESAAELAYAAYCEAVDNRAANGWPLPPFADLPEERRRAWIVAAERIIDCSKATYAVTLGHGAKD